MKIISNPRLFKIDSDNLIGKTRTEKDYVGLVMHHAQYTTRDEEHLAFKIDSWHRDRGIDEGWPDPWRGVFYGAVIERDGTAYGTHHLVHGTEQVGAAGRTPNGNYSFNKDFFHICLSGHGDKQHLTLKQLAASEYFVYAMAINNSLSEGMWTHGMLSKEKTCPGYWFNKYFEVFEQSLNKGRLARKV